MLTFSKALASVSNPFRLFGLLRKFLKLQKLPDDQSIEDVVPPELLSQYTAIADRYEFKHKDLRHYRPLFLAEEILNRAYKKVGLSNERKIEKQITKLAKKKGLQRRDSRGEFSVDEALQFLSEISLEDELSCLAATLNALDQDVSQAKRRALDWAAGDGAISLEYRNVASVCSNVLAQTPSANAVFQETEMQWIQNGVDSLNNHQLSFAFLPISEIVSQNGLLERLKNAVKENQNQSSLRTDKVL